jgi:rhamnogalacturonan hydrolase
MMLLKSNGGNGTVSDCVFSNFIGHSNAYSLYIDAYWTELALQAGNGILYTDLTFTGWTGTCADGALRAPIIVSCPDDQPCDGIVIEDFAMWTDTGSYEYYKCENAWGSGACLVGGSAHTAYAITTQTVTAAPSGYAAAKMPNDLASGFALTASIPIPTVPTTFFPGATPVTARAYP